MFTLTDIRDIAIQIERNGEATYRQAGENMPHEGMAKVLTWMADEELRHLRWFEALQAETAGEPVSQEVEQMGRELLQQMIQQQTFSLDSDQLVDAHGAKELLSQSLRFEQDTILFYEMLGTFIDDSQVLEQLGEIIEEERKHVAQIERMQRGHAKLVL